MRRLSARRRNCSRERFALVRRAYSDPLACAPVIKLGELESDIVNRACHDAYSCSSRNDGMWRIFLSPFASI